MWMALCTAHAQPVAATNAGAPTTSANVRPGERLSDWLLRQPASAANIGLMWLVPQERMAQQALKNNILAEVEAGTAKAPEGDKASRLRLQAWLQGLPVTGRAALNIVDARWLQAHPDQDPIMGAGQKLVATPPPTTVTVLRADGQLCQVAHAPGRIASDYVAACEPAGSTADWAWTAQADGRSFRTGIAPWNGEPAEEPAPGAWIWAPPRGMADLVAVSEPIIRFLATQGPSPQPSLQLQFPQTASAQPSPALSVRPDPTPRYRMSEVSGNDWGEVGLLQTPTARMDVPGTLRTSVSYVQPYTRLNVMFQPFEWLEAGFRYTSISNRIYGISTQAYKDKSIDIKARLMKESAFLPELAVGFRDLGGTGLFSSEYFVASKRYADFDFSLGIGWGNLGSSGNISNPFIAVSDRFRTRPTTEGTGDTGNGNFGTYFRGPAALFGGVQWRTPWDPLTLKLEYDGNNYKSEPLANPQVQRSAVNVGLVYQYAPGVELSAGIERGNKIMVGLSLSTDLSKLTTSKIADPPAPRFSPTPPAVSPGWPSTAADIEARTGWRVQSIEPQNSSLHLWISDSNTVYRELRVEQITAVMHRDAPASIKRFVLHYAERGVPMHAQEIDRDQWVAKHYQALPPTAMANAGQLDYAPPARRPDESSPASAPGFAANALGPWIRPTDKLTAGITPSVTNIFGGPDAFLLYSLGVQGTAEYRFTDSTWLNGAVNLRAIDNFNKFTYTAPSDLPRVRTFQREYVTSSRVTMPNLQLTHAGQLSTNNYFTVYGGALETMFAGVGGEWLYRPWRSNVAFGVDINRVRQRDFKQDFGLRDYQVNTGHATLYWDTGWNGVLAKISAGQYLAGDKGVTLDISRRFDNGLIVGAYATKTNVSAAQFGEGSFDKGVYLTIPFDALLPRSSNFTGTFRWNPLTRDGGAKLARGNQLYDMTSARDRRAFKFGPPKSGEPSAGDNVFEWDDGDAGDHGPLWLLTDLGRSAKTLGQQMISSSSASSWLWAGGLVLASSVIDKRVDKFSQNHLQSSAALNAGKAASALPLLMGLGAGAAAIGLAGDGYTDTGWTALKAGALALGVNTVTRYAVGRARPTEGLGATQFDGFKSGSFSSSFPSNHTALAFALVTPFAQQYDMPWLYGAAAITGMGRLPGRKHWVSDVVAGGVVGYAIGSLLSDQETMKRGRAQVSIGLGSIHAKWDF